ncbi:hypothetical protein ACLOJK_009935 [Asimina triloba]
MGWSPKYAVNAFLETLKLRHDSLNSPEPASNEFISALAAGMSAQLIVEVSPNFSASTLALAAAARQTGGRLICILPEPPKLDESNNCIDNSGLEDFVEFKVGDPLQLLPLYKNIDFSVVDCKTDNYFAFLQMLDVNPRKSMVVANNLVGGRKGMGGHVRGMKGAGAVRSVKHPIGKGMEVTMIGRSSEFGKKETRKTGVGRAKRPSRSNWIVKVDEESGEEHFFRLPRSP